MTLAQIGFDVGAIPSDVVMIGMVVSFLLPAAIALINRYHWPPEVKAVCAFLCSLVAAAAICWFSGYFTGRDVLSMLLLVFFVAQAVFHVFWRPSGIADDLERVSG